MPLPCDPDADDPPLDTARIQEALDACQDNFVLYRITLRNSPNFTSWSAGRTASPHGA
jgi:hypothetical protein